VRQGEEFTYFKDEHGVHVRHVPGENYEAPINRVYAIATTTDGACFVAVMTMAEVDKIKRMSRNTRDDGPWKQWPTEMMKKTALRRLSKLLPTMRDLMKGDLDEYEPPDIDMPPREPPLDQIIGASSADMKGAAPADAADEDGGAQPPKAAAAVAAPSPDAIAVAHRRGGEARIAGMARKAVPPEYRDAARVEESRAWQAGWDEVSSSPGGGALLAMITVAVLCASVLPGIAAHKHHTPAKPAASAMAPPVPVALPGIAFTDRWPTEADAIPAKTVATLTLRPPSPAHRPIAGLTMLDALMAGGLAGIGVLFFVATEIDRQRWRDATWRMPPILDLQEARSAQ
jgi:hypothetical protein